MNVETVIEGLTTGAMMYLVAYHMARGYGVVGRISHPHQVWALTVVRVAR